MHPHNEGKAPHVYLRREFDAWSTDGIEFVPIDAAPPAPAARREEDKLFAYRAWEKHFDSAVVDAMLFGTGMVPAQPHYPGVAAHATPDASISVRRAYFEAHEDDDRFWISDSITRGEVERVLLL